MAPPHRDRWILLIGVTKAIKSASLAILAVLALVLSHGDRGVGLRHWAFALGINPGNHWLHVASDRLELLGPGKLQLIAGGMALYAVLFAIEGAGLLLGKRWGEYVTIAITGSFIPIEVYETLRHPHVPRAVMTVLNVAAVAYLVHRVRRRAGPRHEAEGGTTSPEGDAACAPSPSRRY